MPRPPQGTYRRYCVGCHGVLGDGEGENAQWIDPKPRNFTLGIFKCRSTTTGTLPLDSDHLQHHRTGSGQLEHAVVESAFGAATSGSGGLREALLGALCHGKAGSADSNSAQAGGHRRQNQSGAGRVSEGGMLEVPRANGKREMDRPPRRLRTIRTGRFRPITFTMERASNAAPRDEDLYKIFMTGLDGTPMPSWSDNIKPDEAWDLVFYLRSLQPMKSKEKEIARQIGLKPGAPSAAPAPAPQQ